MKYCNGCKLTKEIKDFWKSQSLCIECTKYRQKHRWHSRSPKQRLIHHLRDKYKITFEEFQKAWQDQGGCCKICKRELPDLMVYENRRRGYAVDHNHDTGDFRGILCTNCNSLLGMALDSVDILMSAAKYLEENGSYHLGG